MKGHLKENINIEILNIHCLKTDEKINTIFTELSIEQIYSGFIQSKQNLHVPVPLRLITYQVVFRICLLKTQNDKMGNSNLRGVMTGSWLWDS